MISVVIADDHPMVRHGLRALLATDPEIEVVGEAGDSQEALRLIEARRPDLALVDISMPGGSGIDVARAIRDAQLPTAVVILSMYTGAQVVGEALAAGARAYILKEAEGSELLRAIHDVAAGAAPVLGTFVEGPSDEPEADPLTDRERETVALIACGLTNKEIAEQLHLSSRTVENYRASAMRKLGVTSTADLTLYAVRRGLLRLR